MSRKTRAAAMGLLAFLFGSCSKPAPPPATAPLPEITADSEVPDFVDLGFRISKHEKQKDGSVALSALGVHQGREVAILVVLGSDWEGARPDPEIPIQSYLGPVAFRSLGESSDALIQVIDLLYGTELRPVKMRPQVAFQGWSLEGEPAHLENGPTKIKLFHEPDDEDKYAELYLNIDLANGILQIREKDPEYRNAIMRGLSAGRGD